MAHVYTVPPIPGVKDLFTLLEFLKDAEKFAERLSAMEKVRDEINALVEAVGKVEEIERLRIQADTDRGNARLILEEANAESANAKVQADSVLAQARAKAEEELRAAVVKREQSEAHARQILADLNSRESALNAREKALQQREDEASALFKRGQSLTEEFTGKLAKLKAAGVV